MIWTPRLASRRIGARNTRTGRVVCAVLLEQQNYGECCWSGVVCLWVCGRGGDSSLLWVWSTSPRGDHTRTNVGHSLNEHDLFSLEEQFCVFPVLYSGGTPQSPPPCCRISSAKNFDYFFSSASTFPKRNVPPKGTRPIRKPNWPRSRRKSETRSWQREREKSGTKPGLFLLVLNRRRGSSNRRCERRSPRRINSAPTISPRLAAT